jgi:hypothetical protein
VIAQFLDGTPAEFPNRYREGSASGLLPIGIEQEIFVSKMRGEQGNNLFKEYAASATKAGDPSEFSPWTAPTTLTGSTNRRRPGRRWRPVYDHCRAGIDRLPASGISHFRLLW